MNDLRHICDLIFILFVYSNNFLGCYIYLEKNRRSGCMFLVSLNLRRGHEEREREKKQPIPKLIK